MCCNCMLVTYEPATMAGKPTKQQSLIFSVFDIPENVEGNFKAKCKLKVFEKVFEILFKNICICI